MNERCGADSALKLTVLGQVDLGRRDAWNDPGFDGLAKVVQHKFDEWSHFSANDDVVWIEYVR